MNRTPMRSRNDRYRQAEKARKALFEAVSRS